MGELVALNTQVLEEPVATRYLETVTRVLRAARLLRLERHDVDRRSLDHIARVTGGRFFPARRSEELLPSDA